MLSRRGFFGVGLPWLFCLVLAVLLFLAWDDRCAWKIEAQQQRAMAEWSVRRMNQQTAACIEQIHNLESQLK